MKTRLHAVAAFLAAAVFVNAQDTSTFAADTAALLAEKAYLEAKVAKLKAEENLQTQLDAASTAQKALDQADQDAKDKAQLDTLKAIGDLAAKMPTGSYTATTDGVATPKAMQLAFASLGHATTDLQAKIGSRLEGKKVVFVDAIPGPKASFELLFYEHLMSELGKDAGAVTKTLPTQIQSVGAAAVISALPSIVSAVSGFFKVDVTEKVFDAKLTGGMAVTSLTGRLAGTKDTAVYFSPEAFAFSELADLASTQLGASIATLSEQDAALAARAEAIDTSAQEKAVTQATNDLAATKAEVALLKGRNDLLNELAKASPQNAPAYLASIKENGDRLLLLGGRLAEQNAKLAAAEAALAPDKAAKEKIAGVRARIAKLFADLRSTDGTPPLFVRLVRDRLLRDMTAAPDEVRYVQLSVAAAPQGAITRKSFWGQSAKASSLVALEYRVADGSSKIIAAGILADYRMEEVKPTEPKAPTSRPVAK